MKGGGNKMKKINIILVCMLMITTSISFITIADGNLNDSEKIQFKQLLNIQELKVYAIYEENMVPHNSVVLNNPPNIPSKPSGPTTVIVGYPYLYTTVTTDPDGDNVSYGWDGGNGIVDFWTSYYPSGYTCAVNIRFLNIGTFYLQVKAKDQYGAESNFSQTLIVTVTDSGTNHPPNTPSNPYPSNGETAVDINSDLSWMGGDPDLGDSVSYDVYFGSTLPLSKVASNITTTIYNPGLIFEGLTYFWSIVAWDNHGMSTQGPIWHFTTIGVSNNPPLKPIISGPGTGKIEQSYTFSAMTTDPENDLVSYWFDWGDGNDSGWVGPYNSGDICKESHIWNTMGSYSIKVKVKDNKNAESVWSNSSLITMPKIYSYNPIIQLLFKMLERFPFLEKILNQYYYN